MIRKLVCVALFLDIAESTCVPALPPLTFDKTSVPSTGRLLAWEIFYVRAQKDVPGSNSPAEIYFKDFNFRSKTDAAVPLKAIQLVLIPLSDFSTMADTSFCSYDANFVKKNASSVVVTVQDLNGQAQVSRIIKESGIYVLSVSNCGTERSSGVALLDQVEVTGRVRVKNPGGYLPSIESNKIKILGWVSVMYGSLLGIWLLMLLIYMPNVGTMHTCLFLSVMACGLMSITRFVGYENCNQDGEVSWLLRMGEACASARWVMTITLVVLGIIGFGGLPESDSYLLPMQIFGLQSLACLSMSFGGDVLVMRHYKFVNESIGRLALLPQYLVGLLVFLWIVRVLATNMRHCVRTGNARPLRFFRRIAIVSAIGMVNGLVCMAMQLMDAPRSGMTNWYFHDLAVNLVPDAQLLFFFAMLLAVWSPRSSLSFDPLDSRNKISGEDESATMKGVPMPEDEDKTDPFASSDEDAEAQKPGRVSKAHKKLQDQSSEQQLQPVMIGAVE